MSECEQKPLELNDKLIEATENLEIGDVTSKKKKKNKNKKKDTGETAQNGEHHANGDGGVNGDAPVNGEQAAETENGEPGTDDKSAAKKKSKNKNKKKAGKTQTDPPTIPISELFPGGTFPEGQIMEHPIAADDQKVGNIST